MKLGLRALILLATAFLAASWGYHYDLQKAIDWDNTDNSVIRGTSQLT